MTDVDRLERHTKYGTSLECIEYYNEEFRNRHNISVTSKPTHYTLIDLKSILKVSNGIVTPDNILGFAHYSSGTIELQWINEGAFCGYVVSDCTINYLYNTFDYYYGHTLFDYTAFPFTTSTYLENMLIELSIDRGGLEDVKIKKIKHGVLEGMFKITDSNYFTFATAGLTKKTIKRILKAVLDV